MNITIRTRIGYLLSAARGQSQFSALLELESASERVRRALAFARTRLGEVISVEQMAKAASLSPRQFGRVFLAETGQTPAKAVERLRVEAARMRIEKTDEPIEAVVQRVGFADPERMQRACVRAFGHPPQALRRMARADRAPRLSEGTKGKDLLRNRNGSDSRWAESDHR